MGPPFWRYSLCSGNAALAGGVLHRGPGTAAPIPQSCTSSSGKNSSRDEAIYTQIIHNEVLFPITNRNAVIKKLLFFKAD